MFDELNEINDNSMKPNFGKFSGRPQSVHSSSMCPSSKNSPKRSPSSMASAPAPSYVKPVPVTSNIVRPNSSSEKASKLRYVVHYYLHMSFIPKFLSRSAHSSNQYKSQIFETNFLFIYFFSIFRRQKF